MSCKDDIIEVLKKGEMKKTDLTKELIGKYSMVTINFYLRELVIEGKLKKTREGRCVKIELVE